MTTDTGSHKRGRDAFHAASRVLSVAETMLRLLPRRFSLLLLQSGRHSNSLFGRARRYVALRRVAASCGTVVDVKGSTFLLAPSAMTIGSHVSIHPFCYIDATGGLAIGDDVSIAHSVSILTTEHRYDDPLVAIRDQGVSRHPTTIESNVWIGAGARVLAGVTIGSGSVVAAGSVVTRDVPRDSIVAGVPARLIKPRVER